MRLALIVLALVLAVPACAQQPEQKQYQFSLTAEEIDRIWDALNRLPGTYPIMKKIERQWEMQKPPAIAVKPEEKP